MDHVGPMKKREKRYDHIIVIVEAFSKFVRLYPTKSTVCGEVLDLLRKQAATFGNSCRIITDRGTGLTSNAFEDFCRSENIQHFDITSSVPRGNGQVRRIHKVVD